MGAVRKDERIGLRLSADKKLRIERAANLQGISVTDFTVDAAVDRADAVVAESFHLSVDQRSWDWFNELLSEPPQVLPGLAEAMNRPSNFDTD
jgi:uncharacterized protein (DUF1778 family)